MTIQVLAFLKKPRVYTKYTFFAPRIHWNGKNDRIYHAGVFYSYDSNNYYVKVLNFKTKNKIHLLSFIYLLQTIKKNDCPDTATPLHYMEFFHSGQIILKKIKWARAVSFLVWIWCTHSWSFMKIIYTMWEFIMRAGKQAGGGGGGGGGGAYGRAGGQASSHTYR